MLVCGVGTDPQRTSDVPPGIALYHFMQMRIIFSSILHASSSPMSTSRYVRLIAMSTTLVLWGTVSTSLAIWANALRGLQPWVSWEHVHSNWNRADPYVWISMSPQSRRFTLLSWSGIPVSSIIIFIFLGSGKDALREYRKVGRDIVNAISSGVLKRNEKSGKGVLLKSTPSPSGTRFVPFPTSGSDPSHLSNVVPPKLSCHILRTLLMLPRRR